MESEHSGERTQWRANRVESDSEAEEDELPLAK